MNNKTFVRLACCAGLIMFGCSKSQTVADNPATGQKETTLMKTAGATQVSGISYYDETDACDAQGHGATFAITLTGDLEGCHYVFIDEYECSPSGTYREAGREHFVGTYKGQEGSFWTNYKFEGKYEGCAEDGSYVGAEIFGRCQHPIIAGSGEGVFEGVSGRLDFKDDIEAGNFPYRGHLRF